MKDYKLFFLFFSFLITYSSNIEQFTFIINKFHLGFITCSETYGTYTFFIDGAFEGTPTDTDLLIIDLEKPTHAKAECIPFSRFDYFECEIDICLYNLTSTKISLPLETPISTKYKIENWKETISNIQGTTNLVVENVTCIPLIQNNFIIFSIESKGCSGNKNLFTIKGDWATGNNIPYVDFSFKIEIDNEKKDIAKCDCSSLNVREFNCEFEGDGDIKFEEKYFKGYYANYMMKKVNSFTHVEKCQINASYFPILNNLIILFILLF